MSPHSFTRGALRIAVSTIPLDLILRLNQRIGAWLAKCILLRDWSLQIYGRPQFFKHQINICLWPFQSERWSFTARGVYAREKMYKGCNILDLCCGDGSYSFLFFADIAGFIDAVDNSKMAIAYASKYFSSRNIAHHVIDIVKQPLPSTGYNFVVWNAAICYFDEAEINIILEKIILFSEPDVTIIGMLPKANYWLDHKVNFVESGDVVLLFKKFFYDVEIKEVDEGKNITFYFSASRPIN